MTTQSSQSAQQTPAWQYYQPGAYASANIRITPTTLADGRDFFYLDDDPEYVSGKKTRELHDPRHLAYRFAPHLDADGNEVPYAAPQMRRDPLTGDWIPMATARMNRPITAGPGATAKGNPLAARKPGTRIRTAKCRIPITTLSSSKTVSPRWCACPACLTR